MTTEEKSRHITIKIIAGYVSVICIAILSVICIYKLIEDISQDTDSGDKSRFKVYLVTNTLTYLYESEALGQLIEPDRNDFNRPLDKALQNMDTLRSLITDSGQLLKVDTINILIEQKRLNTRRLLQMLNEVNAEHLYAKNIKEVIDEQDSIPGRAEIETQTEIQQDTIKVPRKQRKFFRRLADVFAPEKQDSDIVIKSGRRIASDTIVSTIDPSDNIVNVLKDIQGNVANKRKESSGLLLARVRKLQYNNSVITNKINQLLRAIEEEEMNASIEHMDRNRELQKSTNKLLAFFAVLSVLITGLFIFLITKDISRSKYYRTQLEKSKQYAEDLLRAREKLMLMISHDIRAPLSSITGYIDLLSGLDPDERQQYYLDNMKGSSKHILALVNNLLDSHRLESGEMEINPVPFSPDVLMNEIYTGFQPLAEAKGLILSLDLKGKTDLLYDIDPILIRRITENLLSNAVKFTGEGSVSLLVSIRDKNISEHFLIIKVSDTGPGIAPEKQDEIFAEFTRLEQSRKTEGFGLGLSITCKLIHLLKGKISLKSVPGKGSEFTVMLPVKESKNSGTPDSTNTPVPDEANPVSNNRPKIHCLSVDDDPFQLSLTKEMLIRSGIDVISCMNSKNIIDILNDNTFDLVLTDIQMPETDGHQLLELIRTSKIPNAVDIPVIALSGRTDKPESDYIEAGFDGFLNKPFTSDQLINKINKTLSADIRKNEPFNFSSLTAFAEEDKESSASILRTFAEETDKNIGLLKASVPNKNKQQASEIAHKMRPVFTMIGAGELVSLLTTIDEKKDNLSDDEFESLMSKIVEQAEIVKNELNAVIHAKS